jgi:hypothetical protein
MKRSWKLICTALVGILTFSAWASLQAAPLVNVTLEGRKAGTTQWLSAINDVAVGDVIQYRILADMAPVGTSNTQTTGAKTINSLTPDLDGMNTLYLAIRQAGSDGIQVNHQVGTTTAQRAILQNDWSLGVGRSGGVAEARAGTPYFDLAGIRPVNDAGEFTAIDPQVVIGPPANGAALSQFTVMAIGGDGKATIRPMWGGSTTGGGRINATDASSPAFFVTDDTQANSQDPIVGFTPLLLNAVVPEPSTIVLAGLGLVGLVAFARRRAA